jgi:drug/metabolite transporter (DMT)-like permease
VSAAKAPRGAVRWPVAMPAVFVVLWSSGFIGAKFGLPYAEPLTFLLWRFALVTLLLLALALALRAPWPRTAGEAAHIAVAGLLVHAAYLGGVFGAIAQGVSAGEMALIAGLQPVLTAAAAGPLFGERVTARQWTGLALGLVGVALVVQHRLALAAPLAGYALAALAVAGITAGTLYQKRWCAHMDLRSGGVIQFSASTAAMALFAPLLETMRIHWTGEFVFALTWLVVVLSLGAITLLYLLIRRGEAARVTSMFYLVPPVTAVMAWLMFDEQLTATGLAGMVLTVAGVALVVHRPRASART